MNNSLELFTVIINKVRKRGQFYGKEIEFSSVEYYFLEKISLDSEIVQLSFSFLIENY